MKKKVKRKPLAEEQLEARAKSALKRKIKYVFCGAGFAYIPTNDHHMFIGSRDVEIDSLFVYKNIWLICEDTTTGEKHIRDHIIGKNEASGIIKANLSAYVNNLCALFPEANPLLTAYSTERIKLFFLYIPRNEIDLSSEDYKRYSNLVFVQPQTLNYFQWIVQCIRFSAKTEIFRFLELRQDDIGLVSSSSDSARIAAPIIYPTEFTGNKNRVRVVSFMMSAEDLLNTCYVLRKDNWADSIWLYQRLIDKNKIRKIRDFLDKNGEAFYNNIIVSLPDSVCFQDSEKHFRNIDEIAALESNCKLILPKEINSICVIDGQHRIFAHYESGTDSNQERHISELRQQLHLLVTGLIFPNDMSQEERARIQSRIFHNINSNATPVPQNILLQIAKINNPLSDESLAQFVIESLNKEGVFKKMFQVSSLDSAKIKTASIVRFALRYLVTVNPSDGKESLYKYWNGDKDRLINLDNDALEDYIAFCSTVLRNYFGAVRKNLRPYWEDTTSKLLSVISINGFIIALTRQLSINGVHDFSYYDEKIFNGWTYDFSQHGFPFTSSQYRKFSSEILKQAFKLNLDDDDVE